MASYAHSCHTAQYSRQLEHRVRHACSVQYEQSQNYIYWVQFHFTEFTARSGTGKENQTPAPLAHKSIKINLWLTGQEEAGEGDDIQLPHRYVIVVHKEVEQVDGQVTCCRAQLVSVTENSEQVGKVPAHPDLWRVGLVGWQLQLLRRKGGRNLLHCTIVCYI